MADLDKKIVLIVVILTLLILVGGILLVAPPAKNSGSSSDQATSSANDISATDSAQTKALTIDQNKTYSAVLKTEVGEITIALNAKKTPITVNNFVDLARKKFYDGTVFHRVVKDFMIQGGDPKGDGTGGPGYTFADEPFEGEYTRGTVAMANAGPDTNGSQFFIMHQDKPLPKNYVIFGQVTKGIETVDKIAGAPVKENPVNKEESVPLKPVKVKTVEIIEK